MLSIAVSATRHRLTPGRLVQVSNVCTVSVYVAVLCLFGAGCLVPVFVTRTCVTL